MPIDSMFWKSGANRDVHLLRGATGPDLRANALFFAPAGISAADYMQAHGDVTLVFKPLFRGVANGDQFEAFGIHVNTNTGQVRLDAASPPPPLKNNFIIEVWVANS